MKASLSRVILFALDVPKLSAFYEHALELTRVETDHTPDEWAVLDAGAGELALHRIPSPWRDDVAIADPPAVRHGSPHKPVFRVDDLPGACDALEAKGVTRLPHAATSSANELVRCDFVDPEGNVFQLTSE